MKFNEMLKILTKYAHDSSLKEPTFIDVVPVQEMSSFPTQNVKTAKTREIKTAQSYDLKPMHMNDIVKPVSTPPPKSKIFIVDLFFVKNSLSCTLKFIVLF